LYSFGGASLLTLTEEEQEKLTDLFRFDLATETWENLTEDISLKPPILSGFGIGLLGDYL